MLGLAGVPATWIAQVRQAATAADAVRLHRLAAEVEGAWPAQAQFLHSWIDQFDYGAILRAVTDKPENGEANAKH